MPELKLNPEELAMSGFRVFCAANGVLEPDWDNQSDEEQGRWLHMAKKAERVLESLDGKSFDLASRALCELWADGKIYDGLDRGLQLAWNATARHLATIFNSDEIDTLEALERMWVEWARERTVSK
jgi:hypothetical protein